MAAVSAAWLRIPDRDSSLALGMTRPGVMHNLGLRKSLNLGYWQKQAQRYDLCRSSASLGQSGREPSPSPGVPALASCSVHTSFRQLSRLATGARILTFDLDSFQGARSRAESSCTSGVPSSYILSRPRACGSDRAGLPESESAALFGGPGGLPCGRSRHGPVDVAANVTPWAPVSYLRPWPGAVAGHRAPCGVGGACVRHLVAQTPPIACSLALTDPPYVRRD